MSVVTTTVRSHGLLVGRVAKELGIGVQTLHYYEREGLIPAPERSASGYRLYSPEVVHRVRFIRKAQALGLPLGEIREVLALSEHGGCPCGRVQAVLEQKLAEVDRRLRELRGFRRELLALVQTSAHAISRGGKGSICTIVEDTPTPHVPYPAVGPRTLRPGRKRA